MSTDKQSDRSPDDQAAVLLPARLEAFAEALGRAVAETILRDLRAGALVTPPDEKTPSRTGAEGST